MDLPQQLEYLLEEGRKAVAARQAEIAAERQKETERRRLLHAKNVEEVKARFLPLLPADVHPYVRFTEFDENDTSYHNIDTRVELPGCAPITVYQTRLETNVYYQVPASITTGSETCWYNTNNLTSFENFYEAVVFAHEMAGRLADTEVSMAKYSETSKVMSEQTEKRRNEHRELYLDTSEALEEMKQILGLLDEDGSSMPISAESAHAYNLDCRLTALTRAVLLTVRMKPNMEQSDD